MKHSMVLQVAKHFAHLSCSIIFTINYLVDARFAQTQTSFGIDQTVLLTSIETFLSSRYYSHGNFPIQLFTKGGI